MALPASCNGIPVCMPLTETSCLYEIQSAIARETDLEESRCMVVNAFFAGGHAVGKGSSLIRSEMPSRVEQTRRSNAGTSREMCILNCVLFFLVLHISSRLQSPISVVPWKTKGAQGTPEPCSYPVHVYCPCASMKYSETLARTNGSPHKGQNDRAAQAIPQSLASLPVLPHRMLSMKK